jgi:hypothetical protein
MMNEILVETGGVLEKDREAVKDARERVKEAIGIEGEEESDLVEVDQRFKRAIVFLNLSEDVFGSQGPEGYDFWNGEGYFNFNTEINNSDKLNISAVQGISGKFSKDGTASSYGLSGVKEDMISVTDNLARMSQEIEAEEEDVKEAFEELMNVSEAAVEFHQLLTDFQEVLNEAERDDEMLEKIAQERNWERLYEEAEEEESQEQQLEKRKEKIAEEEEQLREELENALELMSRHLELDDEIIEEIRSEIEAEEETVEDFLVEIRDYCQEMAGGEPDADYDYDPDQSQQQVYGWYEHQVEELLGEWSNIEVKIDAIEEESEDEDTREREVMQKIRERINS